MNNTCCDKCMKWKMKHTCTPDENGYAICACSGHEPYCSCPNCPCHKAPVSVCGVRVQTAEGVNIPCRLPRPCKDHEPSVCGRTYLDGAFWKDCQNPRPCKDHEVCDVNYVDARTPEEREADKKIEDTAVVTTATFQQEEASFIDGTEALYNAIVKGGTKFLKGFLAESERLNKKNIKAEIAQAEKRGEVRALEWVGRVILPECSLRDRQYAKFRIKDRLTALKNPTHE